MISDCMPFGNNLTKDFRLIYNVFSNTKERCFRIEFFEFRDYKFGDFRGRSVIESEENFILIRRQTPGIF